MAAALGMILGAGARMLGEHAQQKRQMEMAHDQMIMQMYQKNPQLATTKEGQAWLTKHGGSEVAQGFLQIGNIAQQAHKGFGQAFGGGEPQPAGQAQPAPATPAPSAATPQDPAAGMKQRLDAMEQYMASDAWRNLSPEDQKLGQLLYNRHLQEYEKLTGQKAQSERQQAGFQQQETLRKERVGDEEKLLGERGAQERSLIGARESASLDEARKKQAEGLTGATNKESKPVPESAERARRTTTVERLNKEYDSLHPVARLTSGDYEKNRDQFVAQRLGGVSPVDYINQSAAAAAGVSSDVSSYADKYFPKKK